jgi:DNA-directed RNA polymerase specialized sigma24 family protein
LNDLRGRRDVTEGTFADLIQRVRAGDEKAALELHETYGSQLRRIIRVRLTQPGLRRQMDSVDICQSVFGDFFAGMAMGRYDLDSPAQLMQLLATMARHRLSYHTNKQKAARRDIRRVEGKAIEEFAVAGGEGTPSQAASARELLERFQQGLSEYERFLVRQRHSGRSWDEIASMTDRTADALRKQYDRAMKRVSGEMGLEEANDG